MKAAVLEKTASKLVWKELPQPQPASGQLLLRVEACAVCRTDLHVTSGELPCPKLPLVPGHQIVGRVVACGNGDLKHRIGDRVGVGWLARTCGHCAYCLRGAENLCDAPLFTGYTMDGGFAQFCVCYDAFAFPLTDDADAAHLAPLLCGGVIGHRALTMAGDVSSIGLYGFGNSAHLVLQEALWNQQQVFVFTRPGDVAAQECASQMGASWVGGSDEHPPAPLDAAILFAPVGALVPLALQAVRKGGTVVCAGIHMSDIPSFPYRLLWEERVLRSVANLTRQDAREFLELAPHVPIRSTVRTFGLQQAQEALEDLQAGRLEGAAVLVP